MEKHIIEQPGPDEVPEQHGTLVQQANAHQVEDQESHGAGLEHVKALKSCRRQVVELFADSKKSASATHKKIVAAEKKLLNPIDMAINRTNHLLAEYESEERERAAKLAREQEAAARKEAEDRQIAEAIAAADAGDQALADSIIDEPPAPQVAPVAPRLAKVEGVSETKRWHAEVTDKAALVKYVAEHPEYLHTLEPATTVLNNLARSLKENLRLPGVRAVSQTGRSVRS